MKVERKENSGLVTFGTLACGEVFEYRSRYGGGPWIKILPIETTWGNDDDGEKFNINCVNFEGEHGFMHYSSLVKRHPNAKLVLED